MVRFIAITFIFLAFAFYQLSGGSDFDPDATRMSRIELPAGVEVETLVANGNAVDEEVSRVSLDLTKLDDVLRPEPAIPTVSARILEQPAAVEIAEPETIEELTERVVLPSLIAGAEAATVTPVDFSAAPQQADEVETEEDVRLVSGNRVNVRSGPGTNYGVVNSMVKGDRVVILEDPGTGWVRLRPSSGGPVGWMADFLLTEG